MGHRKKKTKISPSRAYNAILLSLLGIAVISFIVFLPCLKNGFTNWDDDLLVTQNPTIRSLSWNNIQKMFTSFHFAHYHPLVLVSFALEYRFFKSDPRVYHTTNILLHITSALLVFCLIYRINRSVSVSLITALLFSIHPMRVASVAWISERKDVLYSVFFLGACIVYLSYVRTGLRKYYYLTIALFILSLLSKAMAISLVFVLLLLDYGEKRPWNRNILLEKLPFFVLSLLFSMLAIRAHYPTGEMRRIFGVLFSDQLYLAAYGVIFYPFKLLVPLNLSCVYPYPEKTGGALALKYLVSPLFLGIMIAGVVYAGKEYTRKIYWGVLFFLLTIIPVLKIVPFGAAIAADRFTYLPSIGLFYLVAEGIAWVYNHKFASSVEMKSVFIFLVILVFALLSHSTWERSKVWKDDITLWNDVIQKYPRTSLAYNNRGNAWHKKGNLRVALADYNKALEIEKKYAKAYFNRGNCHFDLGNNREAIEDLTRALRYQPAFAEACNNRGYIYIFLKEYDKALSDFSRTIQLKKDYAEAYFNRGFAHAQAGIYDKAVEDYARVLNLDPKYPDAHNNLGLVYMRKKEYDKAIEEFIRELSLYPDSGRAYANRSLAYYEKGDVERAVEDVQTMQRLGMPVSPKLVEALKRSEEKKGAFPSTPSPGR